MADDNDTSFLGSLGDDDKEILGINPLYIVLICLALVAVCFCSMSMMGTMSMRGGMYGGGMGGYGGGYGGYGGGYY
jgi:uncharacterized membrane protein